MSGLQKGHIMSGFISRAACRGHRPPAFADYSGYERPALSSLLLKDRGVARFIVAPSGYGKSALAFEYAGTMFGWIHTFWINAQSPCFIRDLDAGVIASSCLALDEEASLVVFDDLPALDDDRVVRFSREIDDLLAKKCEVIVTSVPTCDRAGQLQRDRIRLGAADLLLDDAELDAARSADERARRPAGTVGPAGRIPALVWAPGKEASDRFAKAALSEEMPADILLAMGSMLVLQRGSCADLLTLCPFDPERLVEIARGYPHLGFDAELDRFEAPSLGASALAGPLKGKLADMVARSPFDAPEQLVFAWAGILMRTGKADRACDVIREVCPHRLRLPWLLENARELVRRGCFYPAFLLVEGLMGNSKGEARVRLCALEALCRRVLGDDEGALRYAKRHAFDESPSDSRILSLLVMVRLDSGSYVQRANAELAAEAERAESGEQEHSAWPLLARAWCAGARGPAELARLWDSYRASGADDDVLCVCASWLFSLLGGMPGDDAFAASPVHRNVERFVRGRLLAAEQGDIDYFSASAGLSMEEAHNRGMAYDGGLLDSGILIGLRQVEMRILSQRRLFEEHLGAERAHRSDWAATHPDELMSRQSTPLDIRPRFDVPTLTLRMFGCFEASIGNVPIDSKRFSRQTVRALLVLLAVNQGRELSREAVAGAMWPRSSQEVARKNFYTIWSRLRRALSLPDGTCPYLVRHQFGCRLESRYVKSDVERLDEICRELLFGMPDVERWSTLFAEIDRDFSSDLMPSEQRNVLVIKARNEYRTRLIDALVAATMSIVDAGSPQWGIWFARAALSHDETREDAYLALMRAQIAGDQRTAAMMTYLRCRRVLSDRLGIDPSPETTMLYESLLDLGT